MKSPAGQMSVKMDSISYSCYFKIQQPGHQQSKLPDLSSVFDDEMSRIKICINQVIVLISWEPGAFICNNIICFL